MVRTTVKKKQSEGLAASKDKSRDMLPRTGMGRGADFVDSASKFLAAYGKFITPVVVIVLIAVGGYYFYTKSQAGSENTLRNEIEKAAAVDKLDELHTKMEEVIAKAEEEEMLQVYASYRYSIRGFELLERPYKPEQLQKVVGIMGDFLEKHGESEEHPAWVERVKSLHTALKADLEFLTSDGNKKLLPWDHHSKPNKPEPKLADGNPILVLVTSAGTLRVELFEDEAGNAVKHFVSLVEEGFFDRTSFSANSFSNSISSVGPYRNATIVAAGAKGRPAGVELEKPTTAEEEDDVDKVTEENPYTIDYQGSTTQPFAAGSIALNRDPDDPMRARSEFFVVIEPSDSLVQNFAPLGRVLGEDGMAVARRLHNAEIYYSYVEQKRKDTTYTPRVYYDGWPVATDKRKEVPDPVRFSKLEQTTSSKNPLVVIELEKGDIVIELFEDIAPNTVANFINLIIEGFYDQECEFYRVEGVATDLADIYETESARIIQGGFDQSQSREGYDYGIKNEAVDNEEYNRYFSIEDGGVANSRGTIAMARTADLNSASTEFFINLRDFPQWDAKNSPYCVFGEVLYGLDIALEVKKDDKIKSMKVIRKRDHKYVPEVTYKEGGGKVEKKAVEIPKLDLDVKDE